MAASESHFPVCCYFVTTGKLDKPDALKAEMMAEFASLGKCRKSRSRAERARRVDIFLSKYMIPHKQVLFEKPSATRFRRAEKEFRTARWSVSLGTE